MKERNIIELYKRTPKQAKAAIWFLVCSFMQKGILTISTPIFTRLLSPDEYGQYSVFASWRGILSVIITLKIAGGVFTQGIVKFDDEKKVYAASMQGLTMTLVSIWSIVYLAFHSFWNKFFGFTTFQMICMLFLIWSSEVFGLWAIEQRVEYNYRILVLITILVSCLNPIIGIAFVLNSINKVTARILGLVVVELIGYSWMSIVQILRGKVFFSKKFWIYAISLNLPLIPHTLSQNVLNSSDRIMIGNMIGKGEAGIYSLAYNVSQIAMIFNTSLSQTIAPWMYQKLKKSEYKQIGRIAYPTISMIAILNIALMIVAPEAIKIFAPKSYYAAVYIIPPVSMATYFMFLYDYFVRVEYFFEKTSYIMIASVSGAVLNIILNYIFINIFGYLAAGYTTLICYMVYAIAHYYFMKKICKDQLNGIYIFDARKILATSFIFMIAGFRILSTYRYVMLRYLIVFVAIIVIYIYREKIIGVLKEIVSLRKPK